MLRREVLAAVVPARHRLAGRSSLALAELRGETLWFAPRRSSPRYVDFVTAALRSTGEVPEVTESADPLLGGFADGELDGFTVVPSSVGKRLPHGLVCVDLRDPLPPVDLVALWRADGMSPPVERVVETARRLSEP